MARSGESARRQSFEYAAAKVFACHALRGRGGEHPCFSWPTAHSPEVLLISYAPPKNPTKRWPTEAQMEGWFVRQASLGKGEGRDVTGNLSLGPGG